MGNPMKIQAEKTLRAFSDHSLSSKNRVIKGLGTFKGMDLGILPRRTKRFFERRIVKINNILARYHFETFDDYEKISGDDLDKIILIGIEIAKVFGSSKD